MEVDKAGQAREEHRAEKVETEGETEWEAPRFLSEDLGGRKHHPRGRHRENVQERRRKLGARPFTSM